MSIQLACLDGIGILGFLTSGAHCPAPGWGVVAPKYYHSLMGVETPACTILKR
jgi:ABC-type antimicrobial peptide transport system permease subunit